MENKPELGANLLVSKVNKFDEHLFERYVHENYLQLLTQSSTLGLLHSHTTITGYRWYYYTVSFHVCFELHEGESEMYFLCRPVIRNYVRSPGGQWVYWSSYAVFVVTYLALACCRNIGRRFPANMLLLSLLVIKKELKKFSNQSLILSISVFRHYPCLIWYL